MSAGAADVETDGVVGDDERFVCADCGALAPEWASINRGVLVCSECCSVHRNLGRHVSQIRSLNKGAWHANQYALVLTLHRNGANNVWEHALVDAAHAAAAAGGSAPKLKKKPVSNDPIIPKKEAFIKAKYVQLAYAIRPPKDENLTLAELNKQLWCCVRTSHVETTLRLLALGADPNYADAAGSNTPLHVAAKEDQALQVELLWLYGADVACRNADGATPAAVAREQKFFELADRLDALEFEVTDRFSMFLCGHVPDHTHNQHFLIPELATAPAAGQHVWPFRRLLQASLGVVLERLVQDVYDEVDRREVCMEWNAAEHYRLGNHQHVAVFLPPTPNLSATRNQLRQKLAKFMLHDFSQLLIDLLKEIRRRYYGLPLPPDTAGCTAQDSSAAGAIDYLNSSGYARSPANLGRSLDESRDYDDVADALQRSRVSNCTKRSSEPALQRLPFDDQDDSGGGTTAASRWSPNDDSSHAVNGKNEQVGPTVALDNYLELKERLAETNEKLDITLQNNAQLLNNFSIIQNLVDRLQAEQSSLRSRFDALLRSSAGDHHRARRVVSPPPPTNGRPTSPTGGEVGAIVMPTASLLKSGQRSFDNCLLSRSSNQPQPSQRSAMGSNHHFRQRSLNAPMHVDSMGFTSSTSSAQFPAGFRGRLLGRNPSGGGDRELRSPPPLSSSSAVSAMREDTKPDVGHSTRSGGGNDGVETTMTHDEKTLYTSDMHRKHSAPMERIVHEQKYSATYQQSKTTTTSSSSAASTMQNNSRLKALFNNDVFPDNLILETELLTGAIKGLLADLQQKTDGGHIIGDANAVFHADSIGHHISRIAHNIVPASHLRNVAGGRGETPPVQRCVSDMETAMNVLSHKCHTRPLNTDETVQAAYDVAKAAKQLLVIVQDAR